MNFADEEYVRLYVRDTDTWRALGFEGQAVLALMLRRFDNSGVYKFGRRSPVRSIMAAIGCSQDVAEKALEALLAEEVWEQGTDRLYWPTYDEAQHCSRSDKYRKRQERARKAAQIVESGHDNVTHSVTGVTNVTNCPDEGTPVTPRRGEGEARDREGKDLDLQGSPEGAPLNHVQRCERSFAGAYPKGVELFDAWKAATERPGAAYDHGRRELFERLAFEGVTADVVRIVVAGAKLDHWARETQKLAPKSILGSAEQREKFMALAKDPPQPKSTAREVNAGLARSEPRIGSSIMSEAFEGAGIGKAKPSVAS